MDIQKLIQQGSSRIQPCSNLLATLRSSLLDLFQAHFAVAQFGRDRTREETLLGEDRYLSQIGRVVSYQNIFFDKGSQIDVQRAMALKMNPILLDLARRGHGEELFTLWWTGLILILSVPACFARKSVL